MQLSKFVALAVCLMPPFALADDDRNLPLTNILKSRPTYSRLGFETLTLPGNESMGMVGGNYLFQVVPDIYAGPAAYGALTGHRGGFFTGGGEIVWRKPIVSNLFAETGLYVGGGGGGSAAVGGGLMLRPYVGLSWKLNQIGVGVSASQVRFPSGHIKSNQLGVTVSIDDNFIYTAPSAIGSLVSTERRGGVGFDRVALTGGVYRPKSGVQDLTGHAYLGSIGYAGFRMDQRLTENLFWGIESGAATRGGADGYAEILGTAGFEYPMINDRLTLGARLALGMGGGGRVSVGGGALAKAGVFAKVQLSKATYVSLEGGMVDAPNGGFKARYGTVQLGMDLDYAPFQSSQRRVQGSEWSLSTEHYLAAARYKEPRHSLDAFGLKIDRAISDRAYFSAQAHSAYSGNAGGYSVGLVGLGFSTPKTSQGISGAAELLAGAAGGGGVSTQGGAVMQLMTYARLDLSNAMRAKIGLGRIRSVHGELNSTIAELSLGVPFGVPGK